MHRTFLTVAVALLFCCVDPVFAESNALPGQPNIVFARFPFSGVSSVTVDVAEIGGAQIANNVSATRQSIDGVGSDVFYLDISLLAGYPASCGDVQTFTVRFEPAGASCAASPSSCVDTFSKFGGAECPSLAGGGGGGGNGFVQVQIDPTFAAETVSAQGITRRVLDHYLRYGQLPTRWRRFDYSALETFGSADRTVWEVYFYDVESGTPHVSCTVETESDPAVALPPRTCVE